MTGEPEKLKRVPMTLGTMIGGFLVIIAIIVLLMVLL